MDWEKLQTKIKKKVDAIGATMVVTTTTHGAFDVGEGVAAETSIDHTVYGLILNYSERDIAGGLAQVGDKQLLLNAKDIPNLESYDSVKITITRTGYSLVLNPISISLVSPANVDLLYKIHARG